MDKMFKPTKEDYEISATLGSLPLIFRLLDGHQFKRILDIGCGYGALVKMLAQHFDAEAIGIDKDMERLKIAKDRIECYNIDIEKQLIPIGKVDLVISCGVVEHLRWYDVLIKEAKRIINPDGVFLISLPNLGSWVSRLSLLLGYQPRDVEISNVKPFGIMPMFKDEHIYHIHTATYRAFKELLEYYDFEIIKVKGFNPYCNNFFIKLIDFVVPLNLKRRLIFVCKVKPKRGNEK